jgi:uncharacterized protein DUF4238
MSEPVIHHYVPQFLLRRFGRPANTRKTKVARLDVASGEVRVSNPRNEAGKRFFYRLDVADMEAVNGGDLPHPNEIEKLLSKIEAVAAPVVAQLVEYPMRKTELEQLVALSNFVVTLLHRTPDGRADLAAADAEIQRLGSIEVFSDPDAVRRGMSSEATEAEVLEMRDRIVNDLMERRIEFESTPTREIGMLLQAIPVIGEWLMTKARWTVQRAPSDRQFVLSDAPVAQYDPTPKVEGAGAGFESSPTSMTVLPIDPSAALLIQPSPDGYVSLPMPRQVKREQVDEINLLSYAQADQALFGPVKTILAGVHADAALGPDRIAAVRRRRPRIWLTEAATREPAASDVLTFNSVNRDGPVTRQMRIGQAAT